MSDLTRLHTMDLFSRFFQENREKFLTFAYSYLRDRVEAEDVLMESMITLWENRDQLGKRQQPSRPVADNHQKQIPEYFRAQTNTPAGRRRYQQP